MAHLKGVKTNDEKKRYYLFLHSVKFDSCEVLPGYPDANNKSIIDFNLDGNVLETLNVMISERDLFSKIKGDSSIESFFGFNFKCEFTGTTELEELTV